MTGSVIIDQALCRNSSAIREAVLPCEVYLAATRRFFGPRSTIRYPAPLYEEEGTGRR